MDSEPAARSSRPRWGFPDRLRPTQELFRLLAAITIAATVLVMVSGALVRLTGSGLGCSDWPACEQDQFVPALDKPHAVMEFVNRMLSGVLGVPVLLVLGGAILRRPFRRDLLGWSLGLFMAMFGEAVLGAFVVKFGLTPPVVIAHFVLAVIMLWNALVLHHLAGVPDAHASLPRRTLVSGRAEALGWLAAVATAITIVVGTVVTGAGPHGGDARVDRLPFAIPSVVRVHGVAAWVCLALLVGTLAVVYRSGAPALVRRRAALVTFAVAAQGAIGYAQYFTGVPQVLVAIHVLGSTLVWITQVRLVLSFTSRSPAGDDASAPATSPAADGLGTDSRLASV